MCTVSTQTDKDSNNEPDQRETVIRGIRDNLVVVVGSAACGAVVGIVASTGTCADHAWWNPVSAYTALRQVESNPLIWMFAPETHGATKMAIGGMVTSALGGATYIMTGEMPKKRKMIGRGQREKENREKCVNLRKELNKRYESYQQSLRDTVTTDEDESDAEQRETSNDKQMRSPKNTPIKLVRRKSGFDRDGLRATATNHTTTLVLNGTPQRFRPSLRVDTPPRVVEPSRIYMIGDKNAPLTQDFSVDVRNFSQRAFERTRMVPPRYLELETGLLLP